MTPNPLRHLLLTGFLAVCVHFCSHAQDTLRYGLPDAEKQFVTSNLQLLAERYNIDISRAQVIQASLYANPNISFSGNLYNPDQKKYLDISNKTGEWGWNVQQLIILAGKRNKQVKLAQGDTRQAEYNFLDLLRTLRYTLRSDFYNIYYTENSINAYKTQVSSLERLNAAYQDLLAKGAVTLKDAVRIKSLLYSLEAEQTSLQNQLNDLQAEVQLLLHNDRAYLVPQVDSASIPRSVADFNYQNLLDSAYTNRYDLKFAENAITQNRLNYSLQRALRVPDITLGAQFDKRGSFVNNASFLSAAIDLPFFNRNQGNIKAAKISVDQSRAALDLQRFTVENDVQKAYTKALNTEKMLRSLDPAFRDQFELLLKGVTENFQKHNISLIEFTDFYESYKDNILQLNQLGYERMQALEDLNFAVGKPLY
ncbi:MAG: TolC family protein [Williamsia sp.]|nr:TolC family protein [Williamsia sp.]